MRAAYNCRHWGFNCGTSRDTE